MPVYPSGGTIAQSVGSPGFGPAPTPSYNASASVRLNPADTANISFNPTIEGSRTTWTLAFWAKRSLLATRQFLVSNYNLATTVGFVMEFDASDRLDIYDYTNPTYSPRLITTQVFRDVGAWYHFTVVLDTTQATNTNRFKLFVNGVQVTAFSTATYPAQFYQGNWNRVGFQSTFGKAGVYTSGTLYLYGGYFADMNFVDGLALTPSSFTATDANTGQLVPAQYTGSFGRNGCYLPFSGAALAVDLGQNPKTTGQDFPYWPYNTLLVNTTSTNGQQNNTFLDSSTNNFTITRNGNTTQGNFTPFNYGGGTTQANGYYSGYFDGNGDSISVPDNAAFELFSNNFTIECWVFPLSTANAFLFSQWENSASSDANSSFVLSITSSKFQGAVAYGGTASQVTLAGTTTVSVNQWYHIALVRSGSSLTLYVNGRQENTSTTLGASTVNNSNLPIYIGTRRDGTLPFQGYISNARIVNTRSEYTTNFTVPTTPLTAVLYTVLLTCQSSQFIDNSTNAFAITAAGNSQPVTTNPFGMTDWSGYFDGTGDYLNCSPTALGTSNFTIECYVYFSGTSVASEGVFHVATASVLPSAVQGVAVASGASGGWTLYYNNGSQSTNTSLTASLNTWIHIAVVRNSGTIYLYINGVLNQSQADTANYTNTNAVIGGFYSTGFLMQGNVSNFRIVNSALYSGTSTSTSNFTPPTAPLTAISGTSLLTCQSSTFVDSSPNAVAITTNGNPYTLTLNNPFGNPINYTTPPVQGWSNYFEGTSGVVGGGLTFPSSSNFAMGTGDFTVEGWYFPNRAADATTPMSIAWYIGTINGANAAGGGVATNQIHYRAGGSSNQITLVTNVTGWNHVAWVRQSGVIYVYLNGIVVASAANTTSISAGTMIVSRPGTDTFRFSGNLSNMRVVKGRAVYTTNFTPSSTPLGYVDGTVLLTCQSNNFADNSPFRAVPTVNTPANISSSSPFIPTQSWSAASYGGTMYFDGSDYLTAPHDASLSPTGNFTIEFWAYNTGSTAVQEWVTKGLGIQIYSFNSLWYAAFSSNNTTTYFINASFGTSLFNTWQHIAVTRSGNTYTGFVNGVATSLGTSASAPGTGTSLFAAGVSIVGTPYYVTGYMSGLRVINGTALYTTSFAPPVLPPTAIANTALLLNATNSGIYDATGDNVIETVGNAQVSTAVKKWGETSVFLDGSGDYLVIPTTNAPCQFGTADFTIEAWIYSTSIANQQMMLSNRIAATGSANFDWQIVSSRLLFGTTSTNLLTGTITLSSNTWYHVAVSRVSGTARMFVNGVLDTSTTTSFNLSNNSITHIGTNATYAPTQYPFIGYIQDFRVTKGVGRYSGAFTPPAAAFAYNQYDIGNQQWLPNNLSVTAGVGQDNLVDSPSDYGTDTGLGGQVRGNYATLNPLLGTGTLSNGNLQYAGIVGDATRPATIGVSSGKWYAEFNVNSALGTTVTMGIAVYDQTAAGTSNASQSRGYFYTGQKYSNGSLAAYGNSFTNGDVIGVALDLDAGKVWFSKNGVFQASGDPVAGTNAAYSDLGTTSTWFVSVQSGGSAGTSASAFLNAGQRAFAYTAPAGFKCLVSTNLPTPTIGTTSSTQADDYFNVNTWTGNGSQVTVGFNPELLWYKSTNATAFAGVVDVLRGDTKYLQTYSTNAEGTQAGLLTKNSTGFVPGTAFSTNSYVSWSWKANGAGVANTAGTIPSTVSVNTTSGCSIVTYTGTGATATVGHGLGVVPSFITIKQLNGTWSWMTYHVNIPVNSYLLLNTTDAPATSRPDVYNGAPSSTVINIGNNATLNGNGLTYVAYCFAPVSGFSAMGVYTGNGAADGPFVYTGFRPAFVMVKNIVSAATSNWVMKDELRAANYNPATGNLYANLDFAQDVTATVEIDLLSNGFKVRGTYGGINGSGNSIVYIAFAEFPFKYSRAR